MVEVAAPVRLARETLGFSKDVAVQLWMLGRERPEGSIVGRLVQGVELTAVVPARAGVAVAKKASSLLLEGAEAVGDVSVANLQAGYKRHEMAMCDELATLAAGELNHLQRREAGLRQRAEQLTVHSTPAAQEALEQVYGELSGIRRDVDKYGAMRDNALVRSVELLGAKRLPHGDRLDESGGLKAELAVTPLYDGAVQDAASLLHDHLPEETSLADLPIVPETVPTVLHEELQRRVALSSAGS